LLCAALLASALVTIWTLRRHRMMLLALLLAASPMVLSLNGLVNPSGIEIDAAILLWVALLRLLAPDLRTATDADDPAAEVVRRALSLRCLLASVVMVIARSEGVAVVAAIVASAAFATADRTATRALLRRRDVRGGGLVLGAAVTLAAIWLAVSQVTEFGV